MDTKNKDKKKNNYKYIKIEIEKDTLIFVKGEESVADIREISLREDGNEYKVVYHSGPKEYFYNPVNIEIRKKSPADKKAEALFSYFEKTAEAISLLSEQGYNILKEQYAKISPKDKNTILFRYLNPEMPMEKQQLPDVLLFPFGMNQSQKKAVENAFSSPVSIIHGPPGTGKTQTILNIIVNAVYMDKTVAIVSANNNAVLNVQEKLEKHNLSFLSAFLGRLKNKQKFLEEQSAEYPDMKDWALPEEKMLTLREDIAALLTELEQLQNIRNQLAELEQTLSSLKTEQAYFETYFAEKEKPPIPTQKLEQFSSKKLLSLQLALEANFEQRFALFRKLLLAVRFGKAAFSLSLLPPQVAVPFVYHMYYQCRIKELEAEKAQLENKLADNWFEEKSLEINQLSMQLFRAELARRYPYRKKRTLFYENDLYKHSAQFTQEYPLILSTAYSLKNSLSSHFIYDYLIIDEASQMDLATAVLVFSTAKNVVIVGDQMQLPNILSKRKQKMINAIWKMQKAYEYPSYYYAAKNSILDSVLQIWKDAPVTLLREHYRCHPQIVNFFNQKFYHNQLIVMTKDCGESKVLAAYRTVPGNHARGHINQRQIDVIKQEILPALESQGYQNIGIITPYNSQVDKLRQQLGKAYEISTVHKFQGREKDVIILSSVDNVIGPFTDNANLFNVAVSRATHSLNVVISANKQNENTNYGDLVRYIDYNNLELVDSKVFSVFDLLYKDYHAQRLAYLKKHKKVSEYDSENLTFAEIEKVLKRQEFFMLDVVVHASLAALLRDTTLLTAEEKRYATHPSTHLDFLIFHKMDKMPVLAIETDGTYFHIVGTKQAERDNLKNTILKKYDIPLLRIRTDESDIRGKILRALKQNYKNHHK